MLSANKVTAIVSDQSCGQFSLLPTVPYAVCLSLRVFYRELRLSKVPMFRARARKDLAATSSLARQLGGTFSSARMLAELADQTISEFDRVCTSMLQPRQQSLQPHGVAEHSSHPMVPSMEGSSSLPVPDSTQEIQDGSSGEAEVELQRSTLVGPSNDNPDYFDASIFDDMAELDIFQHMDPNFDLGAIDAAFGDGTNASLPIDFDEFLN